MACETGAGTGAYYTCLECGTPRQYGCEAPDDADFRPLLNCERCKSIARHAFRGMVPMREKYVTDGTEMVLRMVPVDHAVARLLSSTIQPCMTEK
jgi:hypothetical protein